MKDFPICRTRCGWRQPPASLRIFRFAAWAVLLAATLTLIAAPEVHTLTGGPIQFPLNSAGYVDGDTATVAQFNAPYGIAQDNTGNNLFVADRDNNAIRQIDLVSGETLTFTTTSINKPVGVAVDRAGSVYVLNRGNGADGTLLRFASPLLGGDLLATYAANLINAAGIALDSFTNLYVTVQDNTLIRITPAGVTTTIATITNAGASLKGITVKRDGRIAACDAGRHGIYLIDPASGLVTTNSGFHGPGDLTTANNTASSATARFNQPYGVAEAGDGTLVVTDMGNHRVKAALTSGVVTNLYGVNSSFWVPGAASDGVFPGWWDGTVAVPDTFGTVEARSPVGVVFAYNGTVYTTETYYHLIRALTGTGLPLPPAPLPPVPNPRVGWVDFTLPPGIIISVLRTGQLSNFNSFVFNNDVTIAIDGTAATQTHYTSGATSGGVDSVPDPSPSSGGTPPVYRDSMFPSQVPPSIEPPQPEVTVKAISFQAGRPSSAIVQATFQFVAGSPVVTGDNAALFKVSTVTTNAVMWYTIDGSDPTNNPPSVGPITSPANLSLNIITNTTFKIRAFRETPTRYQPSEIVERVFSPTNFIANKITFGFSSGEASSDFVASPGQSFYSPVTLSILPETKIYSLQFNITVTNLSGPAVPAGAIGFESFLEKPDPTDPGVFLRIPPAMFFGVPTTIVNPDGTTNIVFVPIQTDPPPTNQITYPWGYSPTMPFVDLIFTTNNLIGVGWLERAGRTNLYNTLGQDLVKYSQAHDTTFDEINGKVVLGGYSFQVPTDAQPSQGHTYRIQIGLPSATADGIGTPGSDVYIATPTNTSGFLGAGIINAIKDVTIGQRKYLVGDSAPFRWFNAGDFGNTNLDNSDVMQVFQSAIYRFNMPPYDSKSWNGVGYTNVSDFFDAMDSCGATYASGPGYLVADTNVTAVAALNGLFNGNDTLINYIAFGDGYLDVCDVYVTFRRSLDPSLFQFRRFWTNGVRGAERVGAAPPPPVVLPAVAGAASASFASADFTASAAQTLQIPITANISGDYPVRTLMLNLSVVPLDGSPALTSSVQFAPNPALGQPTITSSRGNGNYAATWLNNGIAGLTGNTTLGTLIVQIPAGASSSAAYAIHFDHASASPNGLAAFPKQTRTGLITLSNRSASSWNDGIPDAWRLRYFGSVYNLLSAATGDADGDTANNWAEYKAGTDPNDRNSVLRLSSSKAPGSNQPLVVHWPSVAGKLYVIERSAALFGGAWVPVSTNNGTGSDMQFQDPETGGSRFYRVRMAE